MLDTLLANAIGAEIAEPPSALERLLALAGPRASRSSVRVDVQRADEPRTREISVRPRRMARGLRLGDAVVFVVRTSEDSSLALIDIGTGGTVSAVLPNAGNLAPHARAGEAVLFPGPADDFDFVLEGRPGRERMLALAWRGELRAALRPQGEATFRVLPAEEVAALCDAVGQLAHDDWAACVCEFEILAG